MPRVAEATKPAEAVITGQRLVTNLIGFVAKREAASIGSDESSITYDGAVPAKDVLDHLFNWEVVDGQVLVKIKHDGHTQTILDPTRKAVVRPDNSHIFGVFSQRYKALDHNMWFVEHVLPVLSESLGIGAAGVLNDDAVAWCSIEPGMNSSVEGIAFRPNLFAVSSLDGSLPTMYHRLIHNMTTGTFMVPDVTRIEHHNKRRHTQNAKTDALTTEEADALIRAARAEFRATIRTLLTIKVSGSQWGKFLDAYVPLPAHIGRGLTMANNKQLALDELWKHDDRVSPWKNTAYGVLAAVNTYEHHVGFVRKAERSERNMSRAATGKVADLDLETIKVLNSVL